MSKDGAKVTFTDGFVYRKRLIVMATQLVALEDEDYEHSRVFSFKEGKWSHFDTDMTVRSVCCTEPLTGWYLGRDGRILIRRPEGPSEERIHDAGTGRYKLGYVHRIREICGKLYICGVRGQIYRREESGWVHFDQNIVGEGAPSIYAIDGRSETDIYAVGQRGAVFKHDSESWTQRHLPTDRHLNWVRCITEDQVYVCGDQGTFFRGYDDQWEDFSVHDLKEDFWCVEAFDDKIYLAADSGLHIFDGEKVTPIDTGLNPPPDGHRLHANDGVLWSFGIEQLAVFDGKKWELVKHPDNPDPGKAISTLPRWKR